MVLGVQGMNTRRRVVGGTGHALANEGFVVLVRVVFVAGLPRVAVHLIRVYRVGTTELDVCR